MRSNPAVSARYMGEAHRALHLGALNSASLSADMHPLGIATNLTHNASYVRLPYMVRPSVRMADIVAEMYSLTAYITLCHLYHLPVESLRIIFSATSLVYHLYRIIASEKYKISIKNSQSFRSYPLNSILNRSYSSLMALTRVSSPHRLSG